MFFCSVEADVLAAATSGDGKKEEAPVPDDDPNGEKLLKTETPLEDAAKLLLPLEKLASERIETWTTAYEIESRRGAVSYRGSDICC